jgi:phosphoribosylanthranilate isomerase
VDVKIIVPRTRVKICGITSVADALLAANAGADAIGLVFYESSPRYVSMEQAAVIASALGPFVTVVGLFVNAEQDFIEQVLQQVSLHVLQFHGDESPEFCQQFNRPYMKAIRMREDLDVELAIKQYPKAVGILLDTYRPGLPGGTGEVFDWQRVPREHQASIILAGGLGPDNVLEAIDQAQPYGVDVSGGVEQSPGSKDPEKVAAFVRNATFKNE